jgi:8-oxo-dGTP pyrophosphatase MutT (NUDIX family)
VRVQYGALPYRLGSLSVEVLLVTSRATKRWIIPKGWPIKGLTPAKAAAREAYEEAGVRGRVAGRAFGQFRYEKRLEDRDACVPCEVQVFPLAVKRQWKDWPEFKERTARWFSAAEAADLVEDDGLRDLILHLAAQIGAPTAK